jgi:hypothetical protein
MEWKHRFDGATSSPSRACIQTVRSVHAEAALHVLCKGFSPQPGLLKGVTLIEASAGKQILTVTYTIAATEELHTGRKPMKH